MGGRKSAPIKKVLGDLRQTVTERSQLNTAIGNEDTDKIVNTTFLTFRKSDYAVYNLIYLIEMSKVFDLLKTNKIDPSDYRKYITDFWIKTKKEKSYDIPKDVDRNLVNSALDAIRGSEQ